MAFARNADIEWMIATQAPPATILDSLLDAVLTIDASGQLSSANAAAERLFGRPREELVGLELGKLLLDPHGEEYGAHLRDFAAERDVPILGLTREVLGRGPGGAGFAMELTITEAEIGGIPMLVAVARDITRAQAASRRSCSHLADHDPLTGLLNRRRFERRSWRATSPTRAATAAAARSSCSTSTTSSTSTTPSATGPATSCFRGSRACCAAGCARPTCSPASAATSSRCCCTAPTAGRPGRSPTSCSRSSGTTAFVARPRARSGSPRAPGWPAIEERSDAGELLLPRRHGHVRGQGGRPRPRSPIQRRAAGCGWRQMRLTWAERDPHGARAGAVRAHVPADRRPRHGRRAPSTSCCCACAATTASLIAARGLPRHRRALRPDPASIDRWVVRQAVRLIARTVEPGTP